MGVHGLWRLLDASGKPVPLETLEGKVLAIDVSIWIHQVLQGYQDRRGSSVPNAHLLGLFHRICKLLYFKIKPVFVFDGGVPMLKKNTIASRKKQKAIAATKAQQMKNDLIQNLIKHTAVKGVLAMGNGEEQKTSSQNTINSKNSNNILDMFKLPSMPVGNDSLEDEIMDNESEYYDSDTSVELSPRKQSRWKGNIHTVDVTSEDFKALPADVRYDVLTDLKETRKQNSWGRLHEMPEVSHEFSDFQMQRLLKRRRVQESLENAEKEMGGKTLTLEELEKMLTEQGIETSNRDEAFRIASDSTTRLIYINDPKGLQKSSIDEGVVEENSGEAGQSGESRVSQTFDYGKNIETAKESLIADINEYDLGDDWDSDIEIVMSEEEAKPSPIVPKKYFGKQRLNPALAYMLEHAGLPQDQILALIEGDKKKVSRKIKSESEDDDKTSIEKKPLIVEKKLEDIESEIRATSSKSSSAFDELISQAPKICDIVSVEESVSEIRETASSQLKNDNKNSQSEKLLISAQTSIPEVGTIADLPSKLQESSNSKILTSDSDTDSDLVEIPDVLIPETNDSLEIFVQSDEALKKEDDIFADVFSKQAESVSDISVQDGISNVYDSTPSTSFLDIEETSGTTEITIIPNQEKKDNDSSIQVVLQTETDRISDNTPTIESTDFQSTTSSSQATELSEQVAKFKPELLKADQEKLLSMQSQLEGEHNDLTEATGKIESQATALSDQSIDSTDFQSTTSSSQATELSEQVAKFKPELLKADQEKLLSMQSQLEGEHNDLTENIGKLERQATAVTDQMRMEAQDLLRLFGIPYIVAPMEAEAQCAYLESIDLIDGTVTDDSDIWLFGGRCVYKNFFNNNKRVMQYKLNDIEHHFKLTRQQMIQLALLVGSDYTVGVSGIGPVTALEILAAFPTEGDDLLRGLGNFCSWLKTGRSAGPGRTALRNKLRNVEIERGFPSQAVVQAYLFPTVDESKERFSWSKPNLTLLADYTRQKFGWTKLKFEETIGPVVRKLAEAKNQKGIASYFKVDTVPKSIESAMSKRVQKAVRRLANADEKEDDPEETGASGKRNKGKRRNVKRTKKNKDSEHSDKSPSDSMNEESSNIDDYAKSSNSRQLCAPSNSEVVEEGSAKKIVKLPNGNNVDEFIPQREKDRAIARKKKLRAIEVFKKSKKAPGRTKKSRQPTRVTKEAKLSESSDSS